MHPTIRTTSTARRRNTNSSSRRRCRRLLLGAVSSAVLMTTTTIGFVRAQDNDDPCAPQPPGVPIGPFFHAWSPAAIHDDQPHLFTTTMMTASDDGESIILLGTLTLFDDQNGSTPTTTQQNVTISIVDGSVTTGWPTDAVPTIPPSLLDDPTAGYRLEIIVAPTDDTTSAAVATTAQLVHDTVRVQVELELPAPYVPFGGILDRGLFFVDDANDVGLVFYEGIVPCNNGTTVSSSSMEQQPSLCDLPVPFAATVHLRTGETIRTGYQFTSTYGFLDPMNNNNNNWIANVWSNVQIFSVGPNGPCGHAGYFHYEPQDGTIQELPLFFDRAYFHALQNEPPPLVAYVVDQTIQSTPSNEPGSGIQSRYVSNFALRKFEVWSGATVWTMPLDTQAIWALAGLAVPGTDGVVDVVEQESTESSSSSTTPSPVVVVVTPPVPSVPTMNNIVPLSWGQPTTWTTTAAPVIVMAGPPPPPPPVLPTTTPTTSSSFVTTPTTTTTAIPVMPAFNNNDNDGMNSSSSTGASATTTMAAPTTTTTTAPMTTPPLISSNATTPTTTTTTTVAAAPTSPSSSSVASSNNSTTTTSTFPPAAATCSANSACAALALDGACCPTIDNVMLECCQMGDVELNCPANPKCAAAALEGACCPTTIGAYLDCCEVVPNECGPEAGGGDDEDCRIMTVVEYKSLQSAAAAAASPVQMWQWWTMTVGTTILLGAWMAA